MMSGGMTPGGMTPGLGLDGGMTPAGLHHASMTPGLLKFLIYRAI